MTSDSGAPWLRAGRGGSNYIRLFSCVCTKGVLDPAESIIFPTFTVGRNLAVHPRASPSNAREYRSRDELLLIRSAFSYC